MTQNDDAQRIDSLLAFALETGVTKVTRLPPESVQVENKLAAFCRDPKCPNFGQSMSCPPHVSGPAGFRKQLQSCKHAIVFRLEIPSESLHGPDRPEVMRLLHEMTAQIEKKAKMLGFSQAIGFAGGSCKPSFCHDQQHCRVLVEQGECRHPEHARTSMSGYGVNVGEMMKSAGWSTTLFDSEGNKGDAPLAWVAGLILL